MPSHVGTGVLLQYAGQEYMATALHVAESCDFNPLIGYGGDEWKPSTWKRIGTDEENDVAVLQRVGEEDAKIVTREPVAIYGKGAVAIGASGIAVGFPGTLEGINWMIPRETLRPVPISVLISLYLTSEDTHYSGGYMNYGFSGGAIVVWDGRQSTSTIVGIITRKGQVRKKCRPDEHAGLVGFADITVVDRILAEHANHDMREVMYNTPHPPINNRETPFMPVSIFTTDIMDAVIMLGRE